MTRKLYVAALALALASSSFAQTAPATDPNAPPPPKPPAPLFTVYGTLNANLQFTQADGATTKTADVKSRTSVSIDSSNIGVKGTYDLPVGGLQIVYQCETGASIDGIGGAVLCNRNSRVGFSHPVAGTIFYGNWDTPYKAMWAGTKVDDPFLNTDVFGYGALLSSPGFNYRSGGWSTASNTSTIGFDVRANNSLVYHSPSWGGLSVKAQYAADEFKSANGKQDPTLYSFSAVFDRGPISVAAAAEVHQDGFALVGINAGTAHTFGATAGNTAGTPTTGAVTTAQHSSDVAFRGGAGYLLDWAAGATTISAMVEQLSLSQKDQADGALKSYDRLAWEAALKHRAGNHELRLRYSAALKGKCKVQGGADCSTKDYGAAEYAVGYGYYLAKTAQVYLHFAQIQNEKAAQYTFPIGGAPAVAGSTPAGADPMAVGLGVRYGF